MPPAAPPNHGSLSSIVSHLVRSSLGSSAPGAGVVDDGQLDRHIAELLLREAREKDMAWGVSGSKRTARDDDK